MPKNSKKTVKNDENAKAKKAKTSSKKTEEDKKKKRRRAFITIFSFAIVFLLCVMGHFLWKRCSPSGPGEDYYYVRVIQPESKLWELKVNDKTGRFPVQYGSTLNISVTPTESNEYSVMNDKNVSHIYYALVQDEETLSKEWKSEQLKEESGKYVVSFPMKWNYDITVQIESAEDYEDFIYTTDDGLPKSETNEVLYTYQNTIYDSKSPITRLDVKTMKVVEVPRVSFNDPICIGSKVKELDKSFFTSCPSFNSDIHFATNGVLSLINDNFLYSCTSFNQTITFPDSLKEILGNFMYRCTSFNKPINTNKIEHLDRAINTTFLMYCTNFNSPITFGDSLQVLPAFFLCNCTKFNQNITIPHSIKSIRDGFLRNCDAMTKTVTVECEPSAFTDLSASVNVCVTSNNGSEYYGKGITITGTYGSQWLSTFKNLQDYKHRYFRNLHV